MPSARGEERGSAHRWLVLAGLALIVAAGALVVVMSREPVVGTSVRLGFLAGGAGILVGALVAVWPYRLLRRAALLGVVLAGLGLLLPWGQPDSSRLRIRYVERLESYLGAPYLWGGEHARGIDCSGLARRPLIEALRSEGIGGLRPRALREALALWLFDASAGHLLEGYGGRTVRVAAAPSLNEAPHAMLQAGDLAVTDDGVHVLIYLGDQRWIEADPHARSVIVVEAPDADHFWLNQPVQLLRWRVLTAG